MERKDHTYTKEEIEKQIEEYKKQKRMHEIAYYKIDGIIEFLQKQLDQYANK